MAPASGSTNRPHHVGAAWRHRLGRASCALALAAAVGGAWLGWVEAGAQAALESLWSLCAAPPAADRAAFAFRRR
jgi:hypothetical protein